MARRRRKSSFEQMIIIFSEFIAFFVIYFYRFIMFIYDLVTFYTSGYKKKSGVIFIKNLFQ